MAEKTAWYRAEAGLDPVARLAAFFPRVVPLGLPVQLTQMHDGQGVAETTTIEFGSAQEALFCSRLPLEFSDVVSLTSPAGAVTDGGWGGRGIGELKVQAQVVAVQYEGEKRAVAVRLLDTEKGRMS